MKNSKIEKRVLALGDNYRLVEVGETDFVLERFGIDALGTRHYARVGRFSTHEGRLSTNIDGQEGELGVVLFLIIEYLFQVTSDA